MGTLRQKRVAKRLVEVLEKGEKITAGELLKSVDYSVATQHQPKVVLESEGVKEELANLGFSLDNAKKVVGSMLELPVDKQMVTPTDQLRAAQEVFKVHGAYAPEKRVNLNLDIKRTEKEVKLAQEYEEKLKDNL